MIHNLPILLGTRLAATAAGYVCSAVYAVLNGVRRASNDALQKPAPCRTGGLRFQLRHVRLPGAGCGPGADANQAIFTIGYLRSGGPACAMCYIACSANGGWSLPACANSCWCPGTIACCWRNGRRHVPNRACVGGTRFWKPRSNVSQRSPRPSGRRFRIHPNFLRPNTFPNPDSA